MKDWLPDYRCEVCGNPNKLVAPLNNNDRRLHCLKCAFMHEGPITKALREYEEQEKHQKNNESVRIRFINKN